MADHQGKDHLAEATSNYLAIILITSTSTHVNTSTSLCHAKVY